MKNFIKKFSLIALLIAVNPVQAGWAIEYVSGNVSYLSSGKLKDVSSEDGTWSIIGGKTGKFSMVSPGKKIYWQGTAKEFCTALSKMMPVAGAAPAKPKINIKLGGRKTIAGHATQKYQVMANGQMHKEIWVTENKALAKEAKILLQYVNELIECRPPLSLQEMVERDPGYNKIVAKGYIMKEVTYESGIRISSDEVVNLKQEHIPETEFSVPAGFRRINTLMEIWM